MKHVFEGCFETFISCFETSDSVEGYFETFISCFETSDSIRRIFENLSYFCTLFQKLFQKWYFDLNIHTLMFEFKILYKWRIKQNHVVFKAMSPTYSVSWCISSCKGCMFQNLSVKLCCFETYFVILSLTVIISQKILFFGIYISSLKTKNTFLQAYTSLHIYKKYFHIQKHKQTKLF